MCAQQGLRSLFEQAKLEDPALHALDVVTRFTSFDDYWQPLLTGQGSAPGYLATRDQQIQTAIREQLKRVLPARAWAIRARTF